MFSVSRQNKNTNGRREGGDGGRIQRRGKGSAGGLGEGGGEGREEVRGGEGMEGRGEEGEVIWGRGRKVV